ncbi:MAG: hypothetical protein RL681_604 [Candidatus Parcubacteria bacterium]|jgi:predicted RNA-binding Zn-ribbon protein involved in translation (DUF1610 family)
MDTKKTEPQALSEGVPSKEKDGTSVSFKDSPSRNSPLVAETSVVLKCPVCSSPMVWSDGRQFAVDYRAFRAGSDFRVGLSICDDCGVLADLPCDLTLN